MGGGVFANARMPATNYVDFGFHGLGGTGVGRYGTSTLPDVTVHPDGTLAPDQGLAGPCLGRDSTPTRSSTSSSTAGGEYAQRTVYLSTLGSSAGKLIGYAPLSSSNAGCSIETLADLHSATVFAGAAPYNPGTPANCLGATRVVLEANGRIHLSLLQQPQVRPSAVPVQYSYLTRNAWAGLTAAPSALHRDLRRTKATNNMVFTSMRYYIP